MILSWLTRRGLENPSVPLYLALTGREPSGVGGLSGETAMRVSAVYACVQLIAGTIATLPWHLYRDRAGRRERVDDHPAGAVIERPNPYWTRQQLLEATVASMLLHGNAYWGVERDGTTGVPLRVWLLDPRLVTVRVGKEGEKTYWVGGAQLATGAIVHFPALVVNAAGVGLGPIAAARGAVSLAAAAEESAVALWERGPMPLGVIQTSTPLTAEQAATLAERWQQLHSRPGHHWRVAVLDSGAQFVPFAISGRDLQWLETRRFQVAEIARLFSVPPHMIGDVERSTSWGTGIEQQTIGFVQFTLRQWIVRLESVLSTDLIWTRGLYVRASVEGLLRGDTQARWQAYRVARELGILSANEIRELEDMGPISGGDDRYVPANWVRVGGGGADVGDAT